MGRWIHPQFYLDTFEIIFVLNGNVHIREEDCKYSLSPGDVLLLDPHKVHVGFEHSFDVDFYWLHFRSDEKFNFKHFTPYDGYEITSLIKRALKVTNTPGYPATSADASMRMLTDALEFQNRTDLSTSDGQLADGIYKFVRSNSHFYTTVESVAAHFGYSTGYISKLFRTKYGIGLKEYINGEQIKHAKNLLLNTGMSIKEISEELQYPDARSFMKFFTYHEKVSPGRFKRSHS